MISWSWRCQRIELALSQTILSIRTLVKQVTVKVRWCKLWLLRVWVIKINHSFIVDYLLQVVEEYTVFMIVKNLSRKIDKFTIMHHQVLFSRHTCRFNWCLTNDLINNVDVGLRNFDFGIALESIELDGLVFDVRLDLTAMLSYRIDGTFHRASEIALWCHLQLILFYSIIVKIVNFENK